MEQKHGHGPRQILVQYTQDFLSDTEGKDQRWKNIKETTMHIKTNSFKRNE